MPARSGVSPVRHAPWRRVADHGLAAAPPGWAWVCQPPLAPARGVTAPPGPDGLLRGRGLQRQPNNGVVTVFYALAHGYVPSRSASARRLSSALRSYRCHTLQRRPGRSHLTATSTDSYPRQTSPAPDGWQSVPYGVKYAGPYHPRRY